MVDFPTTKQLSPSRRLWWEDEVEACSFSFVFVQWTCAASVVINLLFILICFIIRFNAVL